MKSNLSEEQLANRVKTNKKIFKIMGGIFLAILLLGLIPTFFVDNDKIMADINKKSSEQAQKKLDSVISLIKTDQTIKTTKVEYTKDSILTIHIPAKDEMVYAMAFDNLYDILKIGNVNEIEVYQKNVLISSFGHNTQAKFDEFKNNYTSSFDGSCKPLNNYIKQQMNDPSSFEHDKTFITPLLNGNYQVKTIFRGKNAFGGIVLNSVYAEISPKGEILSVKNQ